MPRKPKAKEASVSSSFISLKDFLLLGRVDDERIVDEYKTGPEWINLYEAAKKQCKLYGDSPPIGSTVATVRSGIGGPVGILKKITGTESFGNEEYFVLARAESSQDSLNYLVDKSTWWAYFLVIPEDSRSEKKLEPESIL